MKDGDRVRHVYKNRKGTVKSVHPPLGMCRVVWDDKAGWTVEHSGDLVQVSEAIQPATWKGEG